MLLPGIPQGHVRKKYLTPSSLTGIGIITVKQKSLPTKGRLCLSKQTNHYIYLLTVSTAVLATAPVLAVMVTLVVTATAPVWIVTSTVSDPAGIVTLVGS